MKTVTAVLIGAGARGADSYAPYAINYPNELKFVAVAEPNEVRLQKFKETHGIPDDMCFKSWQELANKACLADAAFICTQDNMHYEPTMAMLKKGYHVLLEKPMSPSRQECIDMADCAKKNKRILEVCHVLRYTEFFSTIKKLSEERIGEIASIQLIENVGYWHQAHSFVRGNWRNLRGSSPMILAKSCHDMDILYWLANSECEQISSFGDLKHFKPENAPVGAPLRCLDGCSYETQCPFYAPRLYLTKNIGWPTSTISEDLSYAGRVKALKEGPYGRCVYHCDNDVVDHQIVNMLFKNGVTASFTMCGFTNHNAAREILIMGTKGTIKGEMGELKIELFDFLTEKTETIKLKKAVSGHSGGDFGLVRSFVRDVQNNNINCLTNGSISTHSHIMAFAAEESRLSREVVKL